MTINSCTKKEVPVLSTASVTEITSTSATCGGTITAEGSGTVVSLGVCWGTEAEPTINDFKTSELAGSATFKSYLKGLIANTTYHVRAYATNDAGIGYGNEVTFTTLK